MKKLYSSIKIIVLIFIANNLFAQTACFTATEFPVGAPHCEGITLIFSDCSVGATSWNWDFGAGAVPQYSNQQNPGLVNFPNCNPFQQITLTINGGVSTVSQPFPIWCNPVACFTVNTPTICAGDSICLNTSCSQPGLGSTFLNYMWDVGNGQQLFSANPCYTYPEDSGCFSIGLIVTNNHGCSDFVEQTNAVCISPPPTFQITALGATTTCLQTLSVDFCAPPIIGGTPPFSYAWSFQGGTPAASNLPCPTGITFTTGQWDVSCTVTDANGCSTTVTLPNYINVANNLTSFILSNDSCCVNECVDVIPALLSNYLWTVNPNGCVSPSPPQTISNPTFCFSCPGSYIINLQGVINGCAVSAQDTVEVFAQPVACINITSNPPSCSFPQTVNVSYCGLAGAWTYLWLFPGGTPSSSTLQNPGNIIYNSCGQFSISLIVTNSNGCDSSITLTDTVNIDCPVACYSILDLPVEGNYCVSLSLNFDATCSTGSPTQYLWCVQPAALPPCIPTLNLGPTSTLNFPSTGCYNVTLQTINALGCTSIITNSFTGTPICVGNHTQPCFTATPVITCAPVPVSFINCTPDSLGIPGGSGWEPCHSWCWNFGDAGACQSAAMNPQHQYQDTGCFDIMLVSKNCGCYDTVLHEEFVCIVPPISHFIYTINCDSPNVVIFDGTNSVGADTYLWSFPGGTPSSSTDPIVHVVYPMPIVSATYNVSLQICNNASGCCDTFSQAIQINNLNPQATIDTVVCFPETSVVLNSSVGYMFCQWRVYDLCNNGILIPGMNSNFCGYDNFSNTGEIIWPHPGYYHIKLLEISINGCADTLNWNVHVNGLTPSFVSTQSNGCAPQTIIFTDNTSSNCVSNPVSYSFKFGDGSPQTPPSPNPVISHTYTLNGSFTVTEFVTDQHGCTDSIAINNFIIIGVALSETHIDATAGSANGSINLTVNGGTSPFNYLWSTGATTQDINNLSAGNYSVTVSDFNNCTSTLNITIQSVCPISFTISSSATTTCTNTLSVNFCAINISGATPPYSYSWNFQGGTPVTSTDTCPQNINFSSGVWDVSCVITDANNCSITVSLPNYISVGVNVTGSAIITDATCGNANGSIDLTVGGGIAPYSIQWSNGATTEDLNNLLTGNYTVTVSDNTGCIIGTTYSVLNMNNLAITEFHTDELCDSANGTINISITNGVAPYSYQWSNGATTEDLNNLTAGNYFVTVTDGNNCTATLSTSVVNHPAPTITVSHVDASCATCHNGSATVFISGGGTSPYTIQWNIGSTDNPIINLDPGTYVACVTDANGCSVCDSAEIVNADGIISIDANELVQVIPNPNNGIFTLEISNAILIENIEILNLVGEKVFTLMFRHAQHDKLQIDFSSGASGVYFLQIKTANEIIRKKILINH